jgi:hypothetical protein
MQLAIKVENQSSPQNCKKEKKNQSSENLLLVILSKVDRCKKK